MERHSFLQEAVFLCTVTSNLTGLLKATGAAFVFRWPGNMNNFC
jgi:hypothetical protein